METPHEIPIDREILGRLVREAWVKWAQTQPSPKPSWLVPYEELSEADKEADRQIGEAISRFTIDYHRAVYRNSDENRRVLNARLEAQAMLVKQLRGQRMRARLVAFGLFMILAILAADRLLQVPA